MNKDIVGFLEKFLNQETKKRLNETDDGEWSTVQKLVIAGGIIGVVVITCYLIALIRKRKKN